METEKKEEKKTFCHRCGRLITNIKWRDGKPYGPICIDKLDMHKGASTFKPSPFVSGWR